MELGSAVKGKVLVMKESSLDIIHINNLLDNSMRCEFLMRTRVCCGVAHAEINDLLLNEFGQLFTLPNNETFVQVNGRITCQNVFTLISQQAIFFTCNAGGIRTFFEAPTILVVAKGARSCYVWGEIALREEKMVPWHPCVL